MAKLLKNPLFWIFILALFLRTYKLSEFPYGFHADEARAAWNALSILKTGKDDRGNPLALYYNTFGDYRPTGIFYLTIPPIAIFGRNEFAVRFPSALLGALTVFPIYLFTLEITKKRNLALFAAFFLAISPWHIDVSRATSEVAMSAFFALFGLYFCIKLINENKTKFLLASIVCLTASYLLYHAIRLLAPFFVGCIILYFWKQIKISQSLKTKMLVVFGSVLLLTLFFSSTTEAKKRFSQVSVFSDIDVNYELDRISKEESSPFRNLKLNLFHNKAVVAGRRFLNEYSTYLSSDFLLVSFRARPYRYITPGVGLLTFIEFIVFVFGLSQIIKKKESPIPLFLLLISPIPAAFTTEDAPNLHRAFFMVAFVAIIEAYGFAYLMGTKVLNYKVGTIISVLLALNFVYFAHMYLEHSKLHKPLYLNVDLDASSYRNVGTKELAFRLDGLKGHYQKIIVTNFPDETYPWYAFFTGKDPSSFNKSTAKKKNGSFEYENIVFSNLKCPSDDSFTKDSTEKLLVVDSWMCAYESKIKDGLPIKVKGKIQRPDGSDVFIFLERS